MIESSWFGALISILPKESVNIMKKVKIPLITAMLMLGVLLCSCGEPSKGDDVTVTETQAEQSIDRGTLEIDNTYAWIGYSPSPIFLHFSKPEHAEALTYSYDEDKLEIDAAKHTVKALKPGKHTVKVNSEHFSASFKVYAERVEKDAQKPNGEKKFYPEKYAASASNRLSQWQQSGNDGVSTIFIGDSFFDSYFWSTFYGSDYYKGKDALLLGISATTSYDWEIWAEEILSKTKPKNIVMHIGTNNIYDDGDNASQAVSALRRMFAVIHEQVPDAHIYYFGISQRAYDTAKQEIVGAVNSSMQKYIENVDYLTYIDTPSKLTPDLLRDKTHPTLSGYKVFKDALANTDIVIADKK